MGSKLKEKVLESERDIIIEALKVNGYNKSRVCRLLGIDRKTLYNKIERIKAAYPDSVFNG